MAERVAPTINGELALLIEQFDLAIRTTDDVAQLKQLILQLAVMGKLVPQDPDDEPAEVLVGSDNSHKLNGEIPLNWIWATLGQVGDWGAGATPRRNNLEYYGGSIPWLKTGELNDGFISDSEETVTELALKETSLRLNKPGDVLIAMYGATIGKLGILEIEATTNQACCACTPIAGIVNRYLFFYLLSMRQNFRQQGAGGAQPNISKTKIVATPIPLPPTAEQHRIVAKVDELMAAADELSGRLAAAGSQRERFHTAALHQLTTAETPARTAAAWSLLDGRFDALYDDPAAVAELKQAILQLAVMGRLVPQDPDDEPAAVLLERIGEECDSATVKTKAAVETTEVPFDLPSGWTWSNFPKFGELARGKSRHRPRNDPVLYEDGKYPFVQTGDVSQSNGWIRGFTSQYGERGLAQSRLWPEGTLCITIAANIAETGILTFEACFPDSVVGFLPYAPLDVKTNRYFQHFIAVAKQQLTDFAPATAQKNINLTILSSLSVPLPPANEIDRIVARVDELFALADEVAARAGAAEVARGRLLAALVGRRVG